MQVEVVKWGNSSAVRLPAAAMKDLQIALGDRLELETVDGHIVLSRELADAGHYPAIDIEQSISRLVNQLNTPEQLELARQFKQLYARYQRARDLIAVGAYSPGSDMLLDRAIALYPRLEAFLQQSIGERADTNTSRRRLDELFVP